MNRNDKTESLARAKERNSFHASGQTRESEEAANRYTMFILGAACFLAGFWATACLVSAMIQTGPLDMIKNLASAIYGQ